jgi:hypothetical protein
VVPSSSVSSGVCLDPEDEGASHTATQCPIPKDLNIPTSTFGKLDFPSVYILHSCVTFLAESSTMGCVYVVSVTERHYGLCLHSFCNRAELWAVLPQYL